MSAKLLALIFLSIVSDFSYSQGFDHDYEARLGDLNGDGLSDLFVGKSPQFIILPGRVRVPLVPNPPVKGFLLRNSGNGGFSITSVTDSQANQAFLWPKADIFLDVVDRNFDGYPDLQLSNIGEIISGAYDQLIFSPDDSEDFPSQVTSFNAEVESFAGQAFAWSLDPNFFEDNAPLVVDGSEPSNKVWQGALIDPDNFLLLGLFLSLCESEGFACAASNVDPANCIRSVDLFDDAGNIIGQTTADVCVHDTHIYGYTPGEVALKKDYSIFNAKAMDYASEIESVIPGGVLDLDDAGVIELQILNNILRGIVRDVFGSNSLPDSVDVNKSHSYFNFICDRVLGGGTFDHKSFERDGIFSTTSDTFHHYDVETKACEYGQINCTSSKIDDVLRMFTYPGYKMKPKQVPIDGASMQLVYFTSPFSVRDPDSYTWRLGNVVQYLLEAGNWPGAIQNRTFVDHFMHPGTVSRVVWQESIDKNDSSGPYIFTHGIGENRWGAMASFISGNYSDALSSTPINMVLGCSNDIFGPKTFETLDKQAIKHWGEDLSGFMVPMSLPDRVAPGIRPKK